MKNYKLSRLNQRCEFGTYVAGKENSFGQTVDVYQPDFTVYCGDYSISMAQAVTLLGLNIKNTREIVIRHNNKVTSEQLVHLDNTEYKIINIDSDKGVNTFDVITLQESKGL